MDDPEAVRSGAALLNETVRIQLDRVTDSGEAITVRATVRAEALPDVHVDALRAELAGKNATEVEAALHGLGEVRVEFWPGWVDRVPGIESRVEISVEEGGSSAASIGSPAG
jgi:hypothetical protein